MVFAKELRKTWCFLQRNCILVFFANLALKVVVLCNLLELCMIVGFNLASKLPQGQKVEKACIVLLPLGIKRWMRNCPLNAG